MADFQEINPQEAWQLMQQGAVLADIRDDNAFNEQHPAGAFHLTDASLSTFFQQVDEDTPIIISCYHGVKSRHVAGYIAQQGYETVYSLRGGFAGWNDAKLPCEKA